MKIITKGQIIPKYYGITYYDFLQDIYICNIFPLNHVIGCSRKLFNNIRNNVDDREILQGRIRTLEERAISEHKEFKKKLEYEFIKGYARGLERI